MLPLARIARLVCALLAAAAAPLGGQPVYVGGAPDGGAGYDVFNDFRAADDFHLAAPASFGALRFWGLLPAGSLAAPRVSWQLLRDAGGLPGAVVASGLATAAGTPRAPVAGGAFTSWRFDAVLGPQALAPGDYWLALHDGALDEATFSGLLWETTGAGAGSDFAVEFLPSGDWTGGWAGDLAFELRETDVVHDGGAPSFEAGYDIFDDFRAADDFALAAPLAFDALRFWALLPGGAPAAPDVFWQILADAGGLPGGLVAEGHAPAVGTRRAPLGATGFDSWQLDVPLGARTLGPGAYWLALHDGAPGAVTGSSMIWERTLGGRGDDFAVELIPLGETTGGWSGNLAFQLRSTSTVPEPSALALLAGALAGLAAARRPRQAVRSKRPVRWRPAGDVARASRAPAEPPRRARRGAPDADRRTRVRSRTTRVVRSPAGEAPPPRVRRLREGSRAAGRALNARPPPRAAPTSGTSSPRPPPPAGARRRRVTGPR